MHLPLPATLPGREWNILGVLVYNKVWVPVPSTAAPAPSQSGGDRLARRGSGQGCDPPTVCIWPARLMPRFGLQLPPSGGIRLSYLRRLSAGLLVLGLAIATAGCGGGGGGGGGNTPGGGGSVTKPNPPTGVQAVRGTVQLSQFTVSWNASTSTGVTGYKIYRKLQSQSSYSLIGATAGAVSYLDTSVPSAVAFDEISYYVTAVGASLAESDASNIFTVPATSGPPPPPF